MRAIFLYPWPYLWYNFIFAQFVDCVCYRTYKANHCLLSQELQWISRFNPIFQYALSTSRNYKSNGLTRTPGHTRGGIRCLEGVSTPFWPVLYKLYDKTVHNNFHFQCGIHTDAILHCDVIWHEVHRDILSYHVRYRASQIITPKYKIAKLTMCKT
jgi:hypothetical protein